MCFQRFLFFFFIAVHTFASPGSALTDTRASESSDSTATLLFAGLCYLIYKDENWALNGALGISASYVADIALPAY